jgi:hypothetical protein
MATIDLECQDHLRRAGWTIGDTTFLSTDGRLVWVVMGRNGLNQIRTEGVTPTEAWLAAVEQAQGSRDAEGIDDNALEGQAEAWGDSPGLRHR